MRYLGIDYGSKRVGTALSDDQGMMAFPHEVFANDKDLIKNILAVIEDKGVEEVVIGHSIGREGEDNPIHTQVETFMTDLTLEIPMPIHLEPEQYTTQEAVRFQGRTDKTDAAAAAIILNSYLTRSK